MNEEHIVKTVTVTEETSLLETVLGNVAVFAVFFVIGYAIGQYLFKPKARTEVDELVDNAIDQIVKGDTYEKV